MVCVDVTILSTLTVVVVKKEKPVVVVKKEPIDSKLTPLPALQQPPASAHPLVSASSPISPIINTPAMSSSASSPRTAIPTDPKELLAFLLKDDNKNELVRKVMVTQRTNTKLTASKDKGTTTHAVKPHSAGTVSTESATKPVNPVTLVDPTGVLSKKTTTSSNTTTTVIKPVKVSSLSPSSVLKTSGATTTTSTSPKVSVSSVLKTKGSGPHVAEHVSHATVPSVQQSARKKKKLKKDSLLGTTSSLTTLKTGSLNTSHILTTATGQQYVFQWTNSGGTAAPVLRLMSKTSVSQQPPALPSTAAATIVTTSDGRLIFTGGSQQLNSSVTQTSLTSKSMLTVQPSLGARSVEPDRGAKSGEGNSGLLKGSAATASGSGVLQSTSSKSLKQHNISSLTSVRTTPLLELPRVVTSVPSATTKVTSVTDATAKAAPVHTSVAAVDSSLTAKATTPAVTMTTSVTLPPPLISATSQNVNLIPTSLSIQQVKVVPIPNPALPQIQTERVLSYPQPQAKAALGTLAAVNNLLNTAKLVTGGVPATLGTTVAMTSSTTQTTTAVPGSLEIPPLSELASPSKQTSSCVVHPLPIAISQARATRNLPLSLTKGHSQTVSETPPQSTTPWLLQKELSPLKSPVEQIMEEHSYLGSCSPQQQAQPQHSPWPPQFQNTSPPQQSTGENVCLPHLKGHNVYTKDL